MAGLVLLALGQCLSPVPWSFSCTLWFWPLSHLQHLRCSPGAKQGLARVSAGSRRGFMNK